MHKIFFDTETTGLNPDHGHRIVEIAAVEFDENGVFTGRKFHSLVNPERDVPEVVVEIHGHTYEKLLSAPKWADINDDFCEFIRGCAMFAHNADFDTNHINNEMRRANSAEKFFDIIHDVTNTQQMFRQMDPKATKDTIKSNPDINPGPENYKLDTLLDRYKIDRSSRSFHGALLDSELLAELYFTMVREAPVKIFSYDVLPPRPEVVRIPADPRRPLVVSGLSEQDLAAHRAYLETLAKSNKADPIGLLALSGGDHAMVAPAAVPVARSGYRP